MIKIKLFIICFIVFCKTSLSNIDSVSFYKLNNSCFVEGYSKEKELLIKTIFIGDTIGYKNTKEYTKILNETYEGLKDNEFKYRIIVLYYRNKNIKFEGLLSLSNDGYEIDIDVNNYFFKKEDL